jgi:tryptophanyl-tRNA synthetase
MSASDSTSYISLNDDQKTIKKKINKYAFSGGKETIEEHRKNGGNPEIDVSFQYLKMFFEEDDKKLKKIHDDYKSGKLLSGELKKITIEKITKFLKEHQEKRKQAKSKLKQFISL